MTEKKPNILLLVVDSFRADKCFGENKSSKTPNLDKLIENGIYFTQSISSSVGTGPSIASLFTGLYPFKSGIVKEKYHKLAPGVQTSLKILKNNDYKTYVTIPSAMDFLGLSDEFEFKESYSYFTRLSSGLNKQILDKFESNEIKEPWFYYIHLLDLHSPIDPPKKFRSNEFGDNPYEQMVSYFDVFLGKLLSKLNLKNTLLVITADHGDYIIPKKFLPKSQGLDSKKNSFGRKIPKKFLPLITKIYRHYEQKMKIKKREEIKKMNISPFEKRSILLSEYYRLADHPDGRLMFDDRLRVPLIFAGYGINQHKIITQQVRNSIDTFPTIIDLAKLENKNDFGTGESLIPLIRGNKFSEKPVYLESGHTFQNKSFDVIGIRTSSYKYFRRKSDKPEKGYLFDLKNDPLEEQNLVKDRFELVKEMEDLISKIKENTKTTIQFDEMNTKEIKDVENELKKLGYI